MSFVVGVDGGGTRTRAVVLDEHGVELARAEGPGGVVTHEAPEVAVQAVSTAVRNAVRAAGREPPGAVLWAGLAGAGRERARLVVEDALSAVGLARSVRVGTDAQAAFYDAFGDGPGVLLIAGTGSIALGRTSHGGWVRVGGWGQRIGDEGSGWTIGVEALRSVLWASDGRGERTALSASVLEHCGAGEPGGLVEWAEVATKAQVAALVPLVDAAARRGDTVATRILDDAASSLAEHVRAVLAAAPSPDAVPIVLWGGLVAAGGPLRTRVQSALGDLRVSLVDTDLDPPAGAARMALALGASND